MDNKLFQLPQLLKGQGIHVSILTETRRSLARHKTQQSIHFDRYTFHFASYVDSSLSTNCLPPSTREWGVCIAIRDGIAYQKIETDCSAFQARVLHGELSIPTTTDENVTIEILGVYAPAKESDKHAFWMQFSTYLLACLQRIANNEIYQLIMVGDWNSHLDVKRDTYKDNIMSTIPSTTANTTSHLQQLMEIVTVGRVNTARLLDMCGNHG
jgi:hypothetical protein